MDTTLESEVHDRRTEAVAFIDAWLSQHAWWADARAIDFALDVRAVLSASADAEDSDADDQAEARHDLAPVAG